MKAGPCFVGLMRRAEPQISSAVPSHVVRTYINRQHCCMRYPAHAPGPDRHKELTEVRQLNKAAMQAPQPGAAMTGEAAREAAAGWGQDSAMQLLVGHVFDQHAAGKPFIKKEEPVVVRALREVACPCKQQLQLPSSRIPNGRAVSIFWTFLVVVILYAEQLFF